MFESHFCVFIFLSTTFFRIKTINFMFNSSGLYKDNQYLENGSILTTNFSDFFQNYSESTINLQISSQNLTINDITPIWNDISIVCVSQTSDCNLIIEKNGSINLRNQSSFLLNNFLLKINLIFSDIFIVGLFSNLQMLNIVLTFEKFPPNFCRAQEGSIVELTNISTQNLFSEGKETKYFVVSQNNYLKFVNFTFFTNILENFVFIENWNSQLEIVNLKFSQNIIKNDNGKGIFVLNSIFSMVIFESIFSNNSLSTPIIICSGHSNSDNRIVNISYTNFTENSDLSEARLSILKSDSNFHIITFNHVLLFRHFSTNPIIEIAFVDSVFFNFSQFIENASPNLVYLSEINRIQFEKTIVKNNNKPNYSNEISFQLGPCFKIVDSVLVIISELLLLNNFANFNLPGFYLTNDLPILSKLIINDSIFFQNEFSSNMMVESQGCVFYVENYFEVSMNNSFFKSNLANVTSKNVGGPILNFFNPNMNIAILFCFFEKNLAITGSLILEGRGNNVSISTSLFIDNSQLSQSFDNPTSFVIEGSVVFLSMKSCLIINNLAALGLFYLNEINNPLEIFIDNVSLFYNLGGNAAGIALGQETNNRTILWRNSKFSNNQATGLATFIFVYIVKKMMALNIFIENVEISDNQNPFVNGLIVSWSDMVPRCQIIKFTGCLISNNSFDLVGPKNDVGSILNLSGLDFFDAIIEDTTLDNNFCYNSWAVMYFVILSMKNVVFLNNSCILTGLFYFDTSTFNGTNVTFNSNYVLNDQMFTFNQFTQVNLKNILFENNSATQTLFFSRKFNSFLLENIKINNTFIGNEGILFYLKKTELNLQNIIFSQNSGHFIFFGENTTLSIKTVDFEKCRFGFAFYLFKSSIISISSSSFLFKDETIEKSNSFYFKNSYFTIENVNLKFLALTSWTKMSFIDCWFLLHNSFFEGFASMNNFLFEVIKTNLIINNTNFLNSQNILTSTKSFLSIKNTNFSSYRTRNSEDVSSLLIFCSNAISIEFDSNIFVDFVLGSSALIFTNSLNNESNIIMNSLFVNLRCLNCNGGALHFSDAKIQLKSNTFLLNEAMYGGATFFECSLNLLANCNFSLSSNTFSENSAKIGGGAIKWTYSVPKFINNTLHDNSAKYGNNIVSHFCRLGIQIYEKMSGSLIYDSFSNLSDNFFVLQNVKSKTILPYTIKVFPLDSYNQFILEDVKTTIEINFNQKLDNFDKSLNKYNNSIQDLRIDDPFYSNNSIDPRIYGILTLIQGSNYTFLCDFLGTFSHPTALIFLTFSAKSFPTIISYYTYNKNMSPNELNSNGDYFFVLPVYIQSCQQDEIYDFNKLVCTSCPINMYVIAPDDKQCSVCPQHAKCNGSNILQLDINYWKTENSSDLYFCNPYLENCLGGIINYCSEGYSGILCQECSQINNYKNYYGRCQECSNIFLNIFVNILLFLALVFLLIFICLIFIHKRFKEWHKLLLKAFIIYLHYIIISFSFKIDIGYEKLKNYYNFLHYISKLNFWISFSCIQFEMNLFVQSSITIMLLYFYVFLIFMAMKFKYGDAAAKKSFFNIYYTISPMIYTFLLSNMICIQIDDKSYLVEDTSIICYTFEYYIWLFCFFVPNIFLICLIPFYIFKILKFDSLKERDILSIFTCGFKKNFQFCEILRFMKNISLITLSVFQIDASIKLLIFLIICFYSLTLEMHNAIYESKAFFRLNNNIQILFLIANYLIFVSDAQTSTEDSKSYFLVMFPLILISHIYVVILCGLLVLSETIKKTISRTFTKSISGQNIKKTAIMPANIKSKATIFRPKKFLLEEHKK